MPPAPLRRLGDGSRPVGWEVIKVLDGELGIVLWSALRSIYEWVKPTVDESERLRLFGTPTESVLEQLRAAAAQAPQIASALQVLGLLRQASGDVEPGMIGTACAEISAWAEGESHLEVAAHFAEAGAYADPESPTRANTAGRLCRRLKLFERSAAWFKRARYASLRTGNRKERIRALLGYGALMRSLGRYEEAEAHYLLAARLAERTRRRKQTAEAHHDLLAIALLMDDVQSAEEHVWQALRLYPSRHPHLPVVGHDWAFALILRRFYSHAVPLVEAALSRVPQPGLKTLMLSTLARAAAGARLGDVHARAEVQALEHVARFPEYAAPALINLAHAAWLLGAWQRADDYASRGLDAASAGGDGRFQRDAARLLESIRMRESPPVEERPPLPDVVDAVKARFLARLREQPLPRPEKAPGR